MASSRRKPNINCFVCNTAVYRRPFQIENNGGKAFCSARCHGISSRREKSCPVCRVSIKAGANKTTCSRRCANIRRAGINYKIGRPKDKVKDQRALKLRLLNERGPQCERCGYAKFEILHAHHKDRNKYNNVLTNLELICPNCHYEEHYLEKSWLNGNVLDGGVG